MPDQTEYDYIIIGAGAAGSLLAARLSEDPQSRVLLLEAGGSDRSLWFDIPAGYARQYFNPQTNWMYRSEPEEAMEGRRLYCPRGKVQGGSGSINAMIWLRGQPQDFDDWEAAGNPGWGWRDVEPWFRRLERHAEGGSILRGGEGPIGITPMRKAAHPICENFLEAANELQLPLNDDFNGARFEGAGVYEVNIAKGKRQSSSKTLLTPALSRDNLRLRLHCEVTRLVISDEGVITGVEIGHEGGAQILTARREVILCAGAVGTPKLLMLSGIGAEEELAAHGIPLRHALPAVGKNLQDHLCASFYFRANRRTLNDELRSWPGKLWAGLRYVFGRKGPLALSVNQAGGFFRTGPEEGPAQVQLYFNPMSYRIPASPKAAVVPEPYSGFLMAYSACRPSSRGEIALASANPADAPLIRLNFLATEHDRREAVAASRLVRKFAATSALREIIVEEVSPGPACDSDEDHLQHLRREGGSIYHLCGSCAMGPDPASAVVDAKLKLHGLKGLRIVDASVFPNITSGNIHAPVLMLAEKAAAMIRRELWSAV